jgi:hypothetical protein
VSRTGHLVQVRGVLEWKNEGTASVMVPAAYAQIVATGTRPGKFQTLPARAVMRTLNPLGRVAHPYQRRLSGGRGKGVIWFDDVAALGSLAPPGVTAHSEFLLTVDDRRVRSLDLRFVATFMTNAHVGTGETCDRGSDVYDQTFLADVREPVRAGGFTYACLRIPFEPTNAFRAMSDDDPSLMVGYYFRAPSGDDIGAYSYFESREDDLTEPRKLEQAVERIDAANPSLVIETNDVLSLAADP